MPELLARARRRLSFANVVSVLALFVALGGTSYAAIVLPANSVDSRELRRGSVGPSEVRTGAVGYSEVRTDAVRRAEIRRDAVREDELAAGSVGSSELRDGQISTTDLSTAARGELTGELSVTFRAAVSSGGAAAGGSATSVAKPTGTTGVYTVAFGRDVSSCQVAATLAGVQQGAVAEQPPAGRITVAPASPATSVTVRTFGVDGTAADAPFHLLVAC